MIRRVLAAGGLASALLVDASAGAVDPVFEGDFVDPGTLEIVELVPDVPWVLPDRSVVANPQAVGDVDIVVRTGLTGFAGAIPLTSPLRVPSAIPVAVAEPGGGGVAIPVVVAVSDGGTPPAEGVPIVSPDLEGNPVLIVAFADLDGDGFIGVTALDGNPNDGNLEEEELNVIGRRFAFFSGGQAPGQLFVGVAGPEEFPLRVAVTAMAYVGPTSPAYFGGVVPEGPAIMTRVPALLRTDPNRVIDGNLPGSPDENEPIGVQISDHFTPDPVGDAYGEAFTLSTDGSDPTIDVADARSGSVTSFGLARIADPATYDSVTGGTLHPGMDGAGSRVVLEVLDPLAVDTGFGLADFRVVPMDRFGNVATLGVASSARLLAGPGMSIVSPDIDADVTQERVPIADTRGALVQLNGTGAVLIEMVPEPDAIALQVASLALLAALRGRFRRTMS